MVDFTGTGQRTIENEMRGFKTVANLKTATKGQILVDPITGIVYRKTTTIDSSGTTEMMGTTTPVSGKTTITEEIKRLPPDNTTP